MGMGIADRVGDRNRNASYWILYHWCVALCMRNSWKEVSKDQSTCFRVHGGICGKADYDNES